MVEEQTAYRNWITGEVMQFKEWQKQEQFQGETWFKIRAGNLEAVIFENGKWQELKSN